MPAQFALNRITRADVQQLLKKVSVTNLATAA